MHEAKRGVEVSDDNNAWVVDGVSSIATWGDTPT